MSSQLHIPNHISTKESDETIESLKNRVALLLTENHVLKKQNLNSTCIDTLNNSFSNIDGSGQFPMNSDLNISNITPVSHLVSNCDTPTSLPLSTLM